MASSATNPESRDEFRRRNLDGCERGYSYFVVQPISSLPKPVLKKITETDVETHNDWSTRRQKTRLDPNANILAGGFGGAASLTVGYPFDTVKVKLQTMKHTGICPTSGKPIMPYKGAMNCFSLTVKETGFFSLYRGMAGLLCFSTPRFALIFFGNAIGLRFFANEKPTYPQLLAAGAFSQLAVVPLIVSPGERIKVLIQTQPPEMKRGQIQCLREVVSKYGIRKGLFRGTLLTYSRDVPSFATYFLTYEIIRSWSISSRQEQHEVGILGADIGTTLVAGGFAGFFGWFVAIPFDTIKNRHVAIHSGSAFNTIEKLWKLDGFRGFYRGGVPILVRSVPANAAAFFGYELAISFLTRVGFTS